MGASRSTREEGQDREDNTVPDASAPRSADAPSGVGKQAKPPAKRLVAGDIVAEKYVVERTLGMGGMGQVLAAKHVKLGTKVAIKVVHPELAADPQAVARFLREAHAMARLESEHVVRVHDVGELADGTPYMIMEYLEGKDLGALLVERGPLPIPLALEYVRQACEALAEAHAAGIIHRDVKPQNLFVVRRASGAEQIRVLDFGLAKAMSTSANMHQLTQTGHVLGTAHYMAPEQLRAGEQIDARTDVWAIGATLFRLLTRQYAFQESNAALAAAAILTRAPAPIESLRADVPPAVSAIVHRCLSKDPAQRFQSVRDLAFAIDQARMSLATASQSFVMAPAPPTSSSQSLFALAPSTPSQSFVPVHPRQAPITHASLPGMSPAPPPTNVPLYVSLALLALLLLGGGAASILLLKKKPSASASVSASAPASVPAAASALVPAPVPSASASAPDDPTATPAPPASPSPASAPLAKPKSSPAKPAAPATSASGKTSVYDSL